MRRLRALLLFVCLAVLIAAWPAPPASAGGAAASPTAAHTTTDHSKLPALQGPFDTGMEVTKACLSCHTEAGKQVMQTTHWRWRYSPGANGQEEEPSRAVLGKQKVLNAFCVSPITNWKACTVCHIGYGWKDPAVAEVGEDRVDCLVCHEQTGTYKKYSYGYGELRAGERIIRKPDYGSIARSVGAPGRRNCGVCHFYGGAHDGAKHGDLDSSLFLPDRNLDVHMDAKGLNFRCVTCHDAQGHGVSGSRYRMKAVNHFGINIPGHSTETHTSCESCHGESPHREIAKLNKHVQRIACQTCHIPRMARGGNKTMTYWDWSTAGRLGEQGRPVPEEKDKAGYPTYVSEHGTMRWERNVIPEYHWFNGVINYLDPSKPIDPDGVVAVNRILGGPDNGQSRIWPFKVMHGRLPYDPVNRTMVVFHSNPVDSADKDAFYKSFDWPRAIAAGMKEVGPFSGQHAFVDVTMYFPITHMVAPKEQALGCNDCHRPGGRLDALTGFYLPGRDTFPLVQRVGWGMVWLALLGALLHGLVRVVMFWRRR
ncbi:MAG: tetrathionate reductase family octaheme c-type cytochrome [Magnetococcales bacterium]|nr:tetrathionate reductase family octaheme c-type cytochrome [Magnetococcales bacterium]